MAFKLPADQWKRFEKAVEYCGLTKQTFVQSIVMAEVGDVEERRRQRQVHQLRGLDTAAQISATQGEIQQEEIKPPTTLAQGSGILDELRRRKEEENAKPSNFFASPQQPTSPVVVNVGHSPTTNGGSNSIVEKLADYVVAGPKYEHDQRMRTAVSVLHTTASTDEERSLLAGQLDAAVAARGDKHEGLTAEKVISGAKFAFDKLSSFLR